jgi:hypothetical protein
MTKHCPQRTILFLSFYGPFSNFPPFQRRGEYKSLIATARRDGSAHGELSSLPLGREVGRSVGSGKQRGGKRSGRDEKRKVHSTVSNVFAFSAPLFFSVFLLQGRMSHPLRSSLSRTLHHAYFHTALFLSPPFSVLEVFVHVLEEEK